MLIIPAIDILKGKVVRLTQGDYNRVKVYSENPVEIARDFKNKGATYLHLVDLEGARVGRPMSLGVVKRILAEVEIKAELGGGLRDMDSIEEALDAGVDRVVLGSKVIKDSEFAKACIEEFGEKVIFGVDVRDGIVKIGGWLGKAESSLGELIKGFEDMGLKHIIYTDISKDGMMKGPNIQGLEKMLAMTKMKIVVSGGISHLDDIKNIKPYEQKGVTGVIVGKALYEGAITLMEALSAG